MPLQLNIIPLPVTMNRKIQTPLKLNFPVTIKQQIKLVLQHSLCKDEFRIFVQVLLLHSLIYSISCLAK